MDLLLLAIYGAMDKRELQYCGGWGVPSRCGGSHPANHQREKERAREREGETLGCIDCGVRDGGVMRSERCCLRFFVLRETEQAVRVWALHSTNQKAPKSKQNRVKQNGARDRGAKQKERERRKREKDQIIRRRREGKKVRNKQTSKPNGRVK